MPDGVASQTLDQLKKTTKTTAKKIAREPLEVAKSAGRQVGLGGEKKSAEVTAKEVVASFYPQKIPSENLVQKQKEDILKRKAGIDEIRKNLWKERYDRLQQEILVEERKREGEEKEKEKLEEMKKTKEEDEKKKHKVIPLPKSVKKFVGLILPWTVKRYMGTGELRGGIK